MCLDVALRHLEQRTREPDFLIYKILIWFEMQARKPGRKVGGMALVCAVLGKEALAKGSTTRGVKSFQR